MKRNGLFVLVLALAAVLCTGCGVKDEDLKSDPLVNADGTAPVGSTLVAPAPQDDFVLLDNKDILAANGLYYASWVSGEPSPMKTVRVRPWTSTMRSSRLSCRKTRRRTKLPLR